MTAGQHTYREIVSQPETWARALEVFDARQADLLRFLEGIDFDQVIVTGCGSTYYLSLTAARLLRMSGLDARACPASELLLYPDATCSPKARYLLLTVSRSGTTSETLRAQASFKARTKAPVLCVTCDSASPLAAEADFVLAVDAAQELSVAQTRSFSSMLLVIQLLAGAIAGQDRTISSQLPDICQKLLDDNEELARCLAESGELDKFFFLGSDALYGIACEAMLKMKEMSLSYSEAYHTLEFRHGPMSMAGADGLVIGLVSPGAARHEALVLQEMADFGASTLAISQAPGLAGQQIALPGALPAWCAPVLHLPALQLLAYHRALFNGCDPDNPRQLSAVISLDGL